jgi:phytoene dehydrogenase-like protein
MGPSPITARTRRQSYDAIVIGSGPNGLGAAITLARSGLTVLLLESRDTAGGGCRSAQLTLPGFVHDICSAIHPLGAGSPLFRDLPLSEHGLRWVHPPAPLAHPFDDGSAALLERSITDTSLSLGQDQMAYRRFMEPLVPNWDDVAKALLDPLSLLHYPSAMVRFGLLAIRSSRWITNNTFVADRARALFAGIAAHSTLPLEQSPSAAIGIVLNIAGHAVGWPFPAGGAQSLTDALVSYFQSLNGEVLCSAHVTSVDELPKAPLVFCDTSPRHLISIAGHHLPSGYVRQLQSYRYGPAAFKVDFALDGPIPWRSKDCLRAGTVHLGGSTAEIALAEREVWQGRNPERPFVLLAQQSLFDSSRSPSGKHTVWAYCHVPPNSNYDMTSRIEAQIERFAPGFRERILDKSVRPPALFEAYNPNCIGGDVNGGTLDWWQLLARPALRVVPFSTPLAKLYICSASTPPGGGVHGMCGYYAALAALSK